MVPASQLHPLQLQTSLPEVIEAHPRWHRQRLVEHPERPGSLVGILTDGDLRGPADHSSDRWTTLTASV